MRYLNTATGWLVVASGGLLFALKETQELASHYHAGSAVYWSAVAVLVGLSLVNTAIRLAP